MSYVAGKHKVTGNIELYLYFLSFVSIYVLIQRRKIPVKFINKASQNH